MGRRSEEKVKQISMSMTGYLDKGKKTRRERFLAEMEQVVPWGRLCALIEPHYPKGSAAGGRPPFSRPAFPPAVSAVPGPVPRAQEDRWRQPGR